MSLDEFLDCTPRMFAALDADYERRRAHESGLLEVMCSQIVAMIANTGFRSFDEPRKVEEFMPSQWKLGKSSPNPRRKRMSRKALDKELRDTMNWYRQNGRSG